VPVLPVRVSAEIPKERIFDVMKEMNKILVDKPVDRGEVLLSNVLSLGVDIIATSGKLKGEDPR
jgi:CxxC motif-containing protein